MSKKYVPSGYQIIDLSVDLNLLESAEIDLSTEDGKIIDKILREKDIRKPILLTVHNTSSILEMSGICTFESWQGGVLQIRLSSVRFTEDGVGGYGYEIMLVNDVAKITCVGVEF